jgi:integrase/recombinase XerD
MTEPHCVGVSGPLAPLKPRFIAELDRLGYAPTTAAQHVRLLSHLSDLLEREGLDGRDVTPDLLARFCASRRAAGYTHQRTERALVPLSSYLRGLGVAPPLPPAGSPETPLEALLERYRDYLVRERGLAAGTVDRCLRTARRFLDAQARDGELELGSLTAAEISGYVLGECRRHAPGQAKLVITELRSLLRFLHIGGLLEVSLVGAVPSLASWRLSGLPRALEPGELDRLLVSCDRSRTVGQRDFAILTLLARLGLRRAEVAALRLADIDWRAGELVVRGKGDRHERLPLPTDVGEALVSYLRCDRAAGSEHVFLRVRAPHGPMTPGAVSAVVGDAGRRAGLRGHIGSHRLRHTAATEMLRAGTPLQEIGQVLRHRSSATTAIYAKVDRDALRSLARSWPGGAR